MNSIKDRWIKYYLPSYLYAGIILTLSSYSFAVPQTMPSFSDHVIHFFEYSILGFLLTRSYAHANTNAYKKYFILFALITGACLGILDENYQRTVPGRCYENLDLFADALGIAAGAITYALSRRKILK